MRSELSHVRENLGKVQGSRFTDVDGRDLAIEIGRLRAEIQSKANSEDVPPPEVIRWLGRIESRLDDLEELHVREYTFRERE